MKIKVSRESEDFQKGVRTGIEDCRQAIWEGLGKLYNSYIAQFNEAFGRQKYDLAKRAIDKAEVILNTKEMVRAYDVESIRKNHGRA